MQTFRRRKLIILAMCLMPVLFAGASVIQGQTNQSPVVVKVDPPSWWANHTINPVRLLIRGNNLYGALVQSTSSALKTSNVRVNNAGTYVFVDVQISGTARPGEYPLIIKTAGGSARFLFHIEPPLATAKNFQGINADDVIYLIMTDRFSDGDPSNNIPADSPPAANDRTNARSYHGGDFRGIIDHLSYLKDLGVTALWLTPWYDNWNGLNACDKPWCPSTYYHGYHAIDYYAVEDHFGSLSSLQELVTKAHALGIKIIQDQVANHVGSRHPWVQDPPLPDWFHGTQKNHELNKFKNSALLSPHSNRAEVRNTLDGWFSEDLPDMNQEQPEVSRYEIQNALWWIGMTGSDGIREDTLQYMSRPFIRDLMNAVHLQYPKLWMVGEVFDMDSAQTSFFIGGHTGWDGVDTKLDSVFDFPLWNASRKVFTNRAPMFALPNQLKYDALYPNPAAVTAMANNHDTMRFMSLPDATLAGAMMHMAFTLSVRGIPELYYGEEIAMLGGDDPDNRRDFPGGFPRDPRSAFQSSDRTPTEKQMYDWTRLWINFRKDHAALKRGRLVDLFYDDDTYVFARQLGDETIVIAFNRAAGEKVVPVAVGSIGVADGVTLVPEIGTTESTRVAQGQSTLRLPAHSALAFVAR